MPGTFENMSSLEYLDLHDNKIKHLNGVMFSGVGTFNGLTKLTRLEMWRNEISDILPDTFDDMINLEYLNLNNNRIERLDSALFSGLFELQHVDLSANKLQYFYPHTFLGVPIIKSLKLARNGELQIPTDRHFINSHFLLELDIARCNISSLSVETFANVSALEWLKLSHNNLKTVDINILRALPELSELYLCGNPLHCDCQLQEVWRWCEDRNIQTVYRGCVPECDTPSEVRGMRWGVLEKEKCL
jgi:Leucine-rich repeat (LRR) protein